MQLAFRRKLRVKVAAFYPDTMRIAQTLHILMAELVCQLGFIIAKEDEPNFSFLVQTVANTFDRNAIEFADDQAGILRKLSRV
jgi:hypothetical protein